MSSQEGLEIFERVIEAGGRVLRAEADGAGKTVGTLALTFDVGRVLVYPTDAGVSDPDSVLGRGQEARCALPG